MIHGSFLRVVESTLGDDGRDVVDDWESVRPGEVFRGVEYVLEEWILK